MPVTIIFGGQYGSEGKGKVAHYFAKKQKAKYCVRVGGTNSGHTVYYNHQKFIFRILPTGIVEKDVNGILPAGSYIDLSILRQEIESVGLAPERLFIDENAVIINENMKLAEKNSYLRDNIGSTLSGTGEAVVQRVLRKEDGILARNCPILKPYICDTKTVLRYACENNERIIIEGTQGFGLSLLHAKDYPFVTSRDTSAAAFLAETGLSPFDVDNIVMVIRTFPIRVSGHSGPLKDEIDWSTIRDELKTTKDLTEYTSCTKRIRRVARFDVELVKRSVIANTPNIIVMNHLDYINISQQKEFIESVENSIGQSINFIGKGPASIEER